MAGADGKLGRHPFFELGIGDAPVLLRRTQQFHRLAEHLRQIGKVAAGKHGIGPHEFDDILTTRISAVSPARMNELCNRLLPKSA